MHSAHLRGCLRAHARGCVRANYSSDRIERACGPERQRHLLIARPIWRRRRFRLKMGCVASAVRSDRYQRPTFTEQRSHENVSESAEVSCGTFGTSAIMNSVFSFCPFLLFRRMSNRFGSPSATLFQPVCVCAFGQCLLFVFKAARCALLKLW